MKNNFKCLFLGLAFCFIVPFTSNAALLGVTGAGGGGLLTPSLGGSVNTNPFTATYIVSTSTSTTSPSQFNGGSGVMIGNSLNGGAFAPGGFASQGFYPSPSLQISTSTNDFGGGITIANTNLGAYAAVPLVFENGATTFAGVYSTNFAALSFSGPNWSVYSGLPPNSLAMTTSDGALVFAAQSSNIASSTLCFGSGPGYTAGACDMELKNTKAGNSNAFLGLGSTTPSSMISIQGTSSPNITFATSPGAGKIYGYVGLDPSSVNYLDLGTYSANDVRVETNNAVRMEISSAGKVGIGTTTPFATLGVGQVNASSGNAQPTLAVYGGTGAVGISGTSPTAGNIGSPNIILGGNGGLGGTGSPGVSGVMGGAGGSFTLQSGGGGNGGQAATTGFGGNGGVGGTYTIAGGSGGNGGTTGSGTTGNGGNGGPVVIIGGAGGTGTSAGNNGGVGVGTSTPSSGAVLTVSETSTTTVLYDVLIGSPNLSGGAMVFVDASAGHSTCTELYTAAGVGLFKAVACPAQ